MSKTRYLFACLSCLLVLTTVGCVQVAPGTGDDGDGGPATELSFSYDFRLGAQGWQADVTDYSLDLDPATDFQFLAELRDLPSSLGVNGTGFYTQSFNTPDDLFTYIKKRLNSDDGIVAGQSYRIVYDIYFASDAPTECFGAGGSPGDSEYLKAGAAPVEPLAVVNEEATRIELNIDKGNQEEGGEDVSLVSTIANGISCQQLADLQSAPYVLVLREHVHDTLVTASSDGVLWLIVGVDSGFESLTGLYYHRIDVTLEPVE